MRLKFIGICQPLSYVHTDAFITYVFVFALFSISQIEFPYKLSITRAY